MPLNLENKYDVVATSQSYRDLRHVADDKTVLENPHKGWYYHYVDNSLKGPRYRDRVKRGEKFITKGLNTVYIRFDWGDIEYAGEGILDWSAIDAHSTRIEWYSYPYHYRLKCTAVLRDKLSWTRFLGCQGCPFRTGTRPRPR